MRVTYRISVRTTRAAKKNKKAGECTTYLKFDRQTIADQNALGMLGRLANLALVVASTIASVAILEVVLRWVEPSRLVPPTPDLYQFYRFDPLLGWGNLPNTVGTYRRQEFSYPISTRSRESPQGQVLSDRRGSGLL